MCIYVPCRTTLELGTSLNPQKVDDFPHSVPNPRYFHPILRRALQIAELGDRNKVWQKETLKHDPEYLSIVIRSLRFPVGGLGFGQWSLNTFGQSKCGATELKRD